MLKNPFMAFSVCEKMLLWPLSCHPLSPLLYLHSSGFSEHMFKNPYPSKMLILRISGFTLFTSCVAKQFTLDRANVTTQQSGKKTDGKEGGDMKEGEHIDFAAILDEFFDLTGMGSERFINLKSDSVDLITCNRDRDGEYNSCSPKQKIHA